MSKDMTNSMEPARRKTRLSAWRFFTRSYGIVLANLGLLARTSWLWLIIMVVVFSAVDWLTT